MRIKDFISDALSFIFPPKCEICGTTKEISRKGELCPDCAKLFDAQLDARCPICKETASTCNCDKWDNSVGDAPPRVLGFYFKDRQTAPQKLIFSLKCSRFSCAHTLFARALSTDLLTEYITARRNITGSYITYPPRSAENKTKYGFDHGRRLAQAVSDFTGAEFADIFVRTDSSVQKLLSEKDRIANADSSLTLREHADVKGKDFIIIDDIITTGATLKTCVRLLRNAGAKSVRCAAVLKNAPKKTVSPSRPSDAPLWFEE